MRSKFHVRWEDIDYEEWTRACGLTECTVEPNQNGGFILVVAGSKDALYGFTAELSYPPFETTTETENGK